MCDRYHGLAGHQVEQLLLDGGFSLTVESAGRLIKNQNGRVLEKHSRNGNPLALAARQLYSALPHTSLVTPAAILVLQSKNELVRMCALRSLYGPLDAGIGLSVKDIVQHRPVQQGGILRHHPDGTRRIPTSSTSRRRALAAHHTCS